MVYGRLENGVADEGSRKKLCGNDAVSHARCFYMYHVLICDLI